MSRSQAITERDPESGVYVSKRLIAAIAIAVALVLGWKGHDLVGDLASALSASPGSSVSASPVSSEIMPVRVDPLLAPSPIPLAASAGQPPPRKSRSSQSPPSGSSLSQDAPTSLPPAPANGSTNLYLTIVNAPPGATVTAPTVTRPTTTEPGSPQAETTTVRATAISPPTPDGTGGSTRAVAAADRGSQGRVSGPNGQLRGTSGRGSSATPSNLIVGGRAAIVPNAPRSSGRGASTRGPTGTLIQLSPQSPVTAMGDHIVIAYDGAIVYVGDHGSLTANSGDAIGGGTVALDADRSTFSSNYDPRSSSQVAPRRPPRPRTGRRAGVC